MANRLIVFFLSLWFLFIGCSSKQEAPSERLLIVTTTGMIEDAVLNVVGDKMDVKALMGPGVDPHLYKATQGDLQKLTNADIIFYNGLHLEGKMGEILQKLSRQKPVFAIGDKIDTTRLFKTSEFDNNYDPHIWFDVSLWKEAVQIIGNYLIEKDTLNANYYNQNLISYTEQLDSLDAYVKESIANIDSTQRVLITAHDAFGYFGKAYNIEVKGLQGISTLSEYGLRDVSDLVDFIIQRQTKAVFIETSVSDKAINAVVEGCKSKGFEIAIGGNLYSDAMGPDGTPEGTYIGMVKANTKTIVSALSP